MTRKTTTCVVTDGVDGFFRRAREHARKLDLNERLEPEMVIAFVAAGEMMKVLSVARLRLLQARKTATPVSGLAGALKRNARAVSRDVNVLESFGVVRPH